MKFKSIKKLKAGKQPPQQKNKNHHHASSDTNTTSKASTTQASSSGAKKASVPNNSEKDAETRDGGASDPEDSSDEREALEEGLEIERLTQRIRDETPETGSQQSNKDGKLRFKNFPLSSKTVEGLRLAKLLVPTDIQAATIPHALADRDILGAAKTGSGKTLAFVVPLIERLYRERWSSEDGLGAIIITPTRELALQIFDVLRVVGKKHAFSCGLVTGGRKDVEGEQARVVNMNILVATPGRLLQHFEETSGLDASQLMVLVLDEADRILDLGFKKQLDDIISYLPAQRQTLLFSATQTKSVKDLARLSLSSPEYLAVHAEDEEVTPKQLVQNYVVVHLQDKLDTLFSFIKSHLKSKTIVFFSTCSQVRFVHECMRGMQPGVPLSALHGKIKQERRTIIYMDFLRKKHACLFATDIAARGLDFPDVDWVVQVDAPEDPAMYIHRVGRTARYKAAGRALLFLMPSEEERVAKELQQASIPIKKLTVNQKRTVSVASQAAALLVSQPECRLLAKKAFVGYLRSLQLLPGTPADFDPNALPIDQFASSLGLAFTPIVPVVAQGGAGRQKLRDSKNKNRALDKLKRELKEAKEAKRREKLGLVPAEPLRSAPAEEAEEDLFTVKSVYNWAASSSSGRADGEEEDEDSDAVDVGAKKRKALKIRFDGKAKAMMDAGAKKIKFNDDGEVVAPLRLLRSEPTASAGVSADRKELAQKAEAHLERVRARLDSGRAADTDRERARVKEKHKDRRLRLKGQRQEETGGAVAYLGGGEENGDEDGDEGGSGSDGGYSSGGDVEDMQALALKMMQKR